MVYMYRPRGILFCEREFDLKNKGIRGGDKVFYFLDRKTADEPFDMFVLSNRNIGKTSKAFKDENAAIEYAKSIYPNVKIASKEEVEVMA